VSPLDDLYNQLRVAAALLDSAAAQIRDIPLAPTKENIRYMGDGMASIFEVLRVIHAVRADLTPAWLQESSEEWSANKRLTQAYGEAIRLTDLGQVQEAVALLTTYVASEPSDVHRKIAQHEIARLQGQQRT
jgi:predicted Zn-dependent protease